MKIRCLQKAAVSGMMVLEFSNSKVLQRLSFCLETEK